MEFEEIKELIKVFGRGKIDKLKIKNGDFEINMQKDNVGVVTTTQAPVAIMQESQVVTPPLVSNETKIVQETSDNSATKNISGETINSPMVGTFYAAPSPDASAFVQVGDNVKKGQTLCILEAMKIMNELEAEYDCKILEVLVKDGESVEYDAPLFRVEKL